MIPKNSDDLILVVGSTGDLGGLITRSLLGMGRRVRVLVRPQSNYQPLVQAGAQPVIGDLKQPSTLEPACKDVKYLITTATATKRGGADTPITVDLEGNCNLIDAAKTSGSIQQFLFTSLSIANTDHPALFVQAKAKTEEYLRSSGLNYTILAPNAFMETWITLAVAIPAITSKTVTIIGKGNRQHSFISFVDVAKFMIASINNPKALNQRIVIGGPKPLSLLDSVTIFEQALKQKITINHIAPGQPIPNLSPELAGMLAGLDFFDSPIEMQELTECYGVNLTSMEEFARNFITTINQFEQKKNKGK